VDLSHSRERGNDSGVSTFAREVEGSFVPLAKGIEALRKLRRVFCGRGSSLVRTTAPVVPLAKGDKTLAFGQSCAGF
jgi:hypothetical protein